jgi:hypothetical protein
MGKRGAILVLLWALSACSTQGAPVQTTPPPNVHATSAEAPPTTNGVYIYPDCEGEGGCPNRNWRTIAPTQLLATQSPNARALGTLSPGEWVKVETVETRLVPVRGVVQVGTQNLPAGEVIYQLEYEGEGISNYWIRGTRSYLDDSVVVAWEQPAVPEELQQTLGLWAQLRRENGQVGWVRRPRFECMGQLAGDTGCRD